MAAKTLSVVELKADPRNTTGYAAEYTRQSRNRWWTFGGQDRIFISSRPEESSSTLASIKDDVETNGKSHVQASVFSDADAADFYKPITNYEGIHRFDPLATWSAEEERNLVRRVCSYKYLETDSAGDS